MAMRERSASATKFDMNPADRILVDETQRRVRKLLEDCEPADSTSEEREFVSVLEGVTPPLVRDIETYLQVEMRSPDVKIDGYRGIGDSLAERVILTGDLFEFIDRTVRHEDVPERLAAALADRVKGSPCFFGHSGECWDVYVNYRWLMSDSEHFAPHSSAYIHLMVAHELAHVGQHSIPAVQDFTDDYYTRRMIAYEDESISARSDHWMSLESELEDWKSFTESHADFVAFKILEESYGDSVLLELKGRHAELMRVNRQPEAKRYLFTAFFEHVATDYGRDACNNLLASPLHWPSREVMRNPSTWSPPIEWPTRNW